MRIEDIVQAAEIEKARRPEEFISWFEDVLKRFDGHREYRSQILLHEGIAKNLFEEVFPLYRLLQHRRNVWSDRLFKNVIGSQPYDVVVSSDLGESYIEIRTADRDYEEVQRMRYFTTHSSVPAIGKVSSEGTKRKGFSITVEQDAVLHSQIVEEKVEKVRSAVIEKCQKEYHHSTALLVHFSDYVAFSEPDDHDCMDKLLSDIECTFRSRFSELYIVGASGRNVWIK